MASLAVGCGAGKVQSSSHTSTRAARRAVPSAPAVDQLSLFETVPPRPDELAATVARLAAIVGHDHVGSPQVLDSHKPGAQKLVEFDPRSELTAQSLELKILGFKL